MSYKGYILAILAILTILTLSACTSPIDNSSEQEYTQIESEEILLSGGQETADVKELNIQYNFDLYKGHEEISVSELDEVEAHAVGFISEYFNVQQNEEKSTFLERIKKYLWEYDTGEKFLNQESFPEYGQRKLEKVYLLPEYLEKKLSYVLPMYIVYTVTGEEKEITIHLAVSKDETTGNPNGILGDSPVESFVRDITKKYNLDEVRR